MASIAGEATEEASAAARLGAMLAAIAAGTPGWMLGEAVARAGISDAFLLAPPAERIAACLFGGGTLAALAFALHVGGAPAAARGGKVARGTRAVIRRRLRHGRTRAEIAQVETGLTVSCCLVLLAAAAAVATPKALVAVGALAAMGLALATLRSLCRLVGHDPAWSALLGFTGGLGAGYLVS